MTTRIIKQKHYRTISLYEKLWWEGKMDFRCPFKHNRGLTSPNYEGHVSCYGHELKTENYTIIFNCKWGYCIPRYLNDKEVLIEQ